MSTTAIFREMAEQARLKSIDDAIKSAFTNPYTNASGLIAKSLAPSWKAPDSLGFTQDQIKDYMVKNDVPSVSAALDALKQSRIDASAQKPITFDYGGKSYTIKPSEVNKFMGGGSRPGRIDLGGGNILMFGYDKDPVTGEYLGTVNNLEVGQQNTGSDWMDSLGGIALGLMTGGAATAAGLGATAAGAIGGATGGFASSGGDLSSALKGGLLGGAGGALFGGAGGAANTGYNAGAAMDAAVAQGAANAGAGAIGSAATGAAGGNMSWLDDMLGITPGEGFSSAANLGYSPASSVTDALGATTGLESVLTGNSAAVAAASAPSWLSNLINQAAKDPLGTASTTLKTMGLLNASGQPTSALSGLLGTGANALGSYLQGQSSTEAARIQADAQLQAAKIAAEAAKFKPVGVTTRFGQSNFGYDANGNLTSAGYTLTPEMKAQQDALIATSGGLLNQFQGAQAATAPMGTAAQRAMQLGQGYLATDPAAQAQKYMAEQQALLAPARERQMASTLQGEFNRGTYGLGTGSTSTGMMAANPRLEALMNAQRQQDLGLAAQATQGGMDYAKFGAGMVGTGGQLLNSMYGTQAAAFDPYNTALGGAKGIESLGAGALQTGIDLGKTASTMSGNAGQYLQQGMNNAAALQGQANSYNPWARPLGMFGDYFGSLQSIG